jgi:hypothetical protein
MGLTIHYQLQSQFLDRRHVFNDVTALGQRALQLPFAAVGELIERSGPQADFERCARDDSERWLLIQCGRYAPAPESDGREHHYRVPATHLVAFTTQPGPGCEPANFGLCRYPATINVPDPDDPQRCRILGTGFSGWSWSSFARHSTPARANAAVLRISCAATCS